MSNNGASVNKKQYIDFLPDIFLQRKVKDQEEFIEKFLKIFQKILSGIDDDISPGAEGAGFKGVSEIIDSLADFFDPYSTRSDFLDWLASWVGLVLNEGWDQAKKREIISKIIPLYRLRGTLDGINKFVNIYVGSGVKVSEFKGSFPVGYSRVGVDTVIGEDMKPYCFKVNANLTEQTPEEIRRKLASINKIINTIKPVHTTHFTEYSTPTLRIGYRDGYKDGIPVAVAPDQVDDSIKYGDGSVVGFSTLIGGR